MVHAKGGKSGEARGEPLEDPQALLDTLRHLMNGETEFPIKVEGTSTLPYTSQVHELLPGEGSCILRLVRPLPHELLSGAVFHMIFAVLDQRFECLITFQRRESYLHYRFALPTSMAPSDRRRHPRFPFRPRENAYVLVQDRGLPGHLYAGPLANIGMGGLALRVDRVLKLEDGFRIPVRTSLFERGKSLGRVRLQDLPRLSELEVRGQVAHTQDRGGEVILGIDFGELGEEQARLLQDCLEFRQRVQGASRSRSEEAPATGEPPPSKPLAGVGESAEEAMASEPGEDPLLRLGRRALRTLVVMTPGARREGVERHLRHIGYGRLELLSDLEAAEDRVLEREDRPALIVADLALTVGDEEEPLVAVRRLEARVKPLALPLAILVPAQDPTLLLSQSKRTRFLGESPEEQQAWAAALDRLLGLEG